MFVDRVLCRQLEEVSPRRSDRPKIRFTRSKAINQNCPVELARNRTCIERMPERSAEVRGSDAQTFFECSRPPDIEPLQCIVCFLAVHQKANVVVIELIRIRREGELRFFFLKCLPLSFKCRDGLAVPFVR